MRTTGMGTDRCSMAGMGVGAGSLKILTGVLVHRVARPLRGSVSCGSGWSVPCVSIQLTLLQGGSRRGRFTMSRVGNKDLRKGQEIDVYL